jgi:hypothetical protein
MEKFFIAVNSYVDFIAVNYGAPAIILGAFLFLGRHLFAKKAADEIALSCATLFLSVIVFVYLSVKSEALSLARLLAFVLFFGVCLFILLSRALLGGLALKLTKWRGEKWLKELDYLYLTFGFAGIFASVNRLPFVTGKIESADVLAPLLLTTAIVLRVVKTRADIGGWNKKNFI